MRKYSTFILCLSQDYDGKKNFLLFNVSFNLLQFLSLSLPLNYSDELEQKMHLFVMFNLIIVMLLQLGSSLFFFLTIIDSSIKKIPSRITITKSSIKWLNERLRNEIHLLVRFPTNRTRFRMHPATIFNRNNFKSIECRSTLIELGLIY